MKHPEPQIKMISKSRLSFIDVLRGWAVLWMIETHVLDVCLAEPFKTQSLFGWLSLSNGFVAVTFVFCAGAGFWLALEKKGEEYLSAKPALWKFLRRLGFIWLLSYSIHIPRITLKEVLSADTISKHHWATSDVLHLIVVSSLMALGLFFVSRRQWILKWVSFFMAILIFLLTPLVWASNPFEKMPYFIATYFSKPPISNFPIFPWMGYFFAGLFVTAVLRKSEKPWRTAVLFLCLGLILKPLVFYLKDLSLQYPAFQYPGDQNWWYSSPGHAVYRLSRVLVVYCGLFLTEQYWSRIRYLPKFFIFMGQESLIYYFWHIVIVYGTAANQGFRTLFHGTLNFSQMALATLAITLGLSVFAYPWHQLKKFYPKVAFWTLGGTIFLSLAYFFIS